MKRSVLLNWLPFENVATGAARRAIELHSRLSGDLNIRAAVTGGFPSGASKGVRTFTLSSGRDFRSRLAEGKKNFWKAAGDFQVWSGDTLPVPEFPASVKVVLTVHDLRFLEDRKYLSLSRYLLLRLFMGKALRRADAVIAVSQWTAAEIKEKYGISSEKIHVIPNAAAPFTEPVAVQLPSRKFLLAVGHLEPRKDFDTLLRAFASIAGSFEGILVIAGRGPLKDVLSARASSLGIANRVVFTGGVTDSELSWLYSNCACLVCPSVYEGFGMTVLEGLQAGVPVIASFIAPHAEVGEDAVDWFTPGDSDSLAERIVHLTGIPVKHRLEQAGKFSWDRSADLLEQLYLSI